MCVCIFIYICLQKLTKYNKINTYKKKKKLKNKKKNPRKNLGFPKINYILINYFFKVNLINIYSGRTESADSSATSTSSLILVNKS